MAWALEDAVECDDFGGGIGFWGPNNPPPSTSPTLKEFGQGEALFGIVWGKGDVDGFGEGDLIFGGLRDARYWVEPEGGDDIV